MTAKKISELAAGAALDGTEALAVVQAGATVKVTVDDILALVPAGGAYTPADATDWTGSADPGDVDDALDQLAARMVAVEAGSAGDASTTTYAPAFAADWTGSADPGNVDDALDQLAARVTDVEGGGGGTGTKTYAVFTPMTSQPPASNYATLDTRNSIAVLDFDASTNEYAFWVGIMPEGASLGSGLKIRLHWMATSATSGDVVWIANVERGNTDLDTDSFDTGATATGTANGTSGIVTVTEITQTNIDGVTAGDLYRLLIYRNAASGSDTMAGDAELIAVEVRSAA